MKLEKKLFIIVSFIVGSVSVLTGFLFYFEAYERGGDLGLTATGIVFGVVGSLILWVLNKARKGDEI